MESTPENNTNTPTKGGQDTLPSPAAQVSPDRDQLIDTNPLRDFSKDLSDARSDPGSRSRRELELLAMNPTVTLEDCRKPRVSVRELQNLASTNAPGLSEDFIRGTTRRQKRSYTQPRQEYDNWLQRVIDNEANLSSTRDGLLLAAAGAGIRSSFVNFKSSVDAFITIASELKELLQSQGASAEVGSIDKDINEALGRIAEYRNTYEDVLSLTSSLHPGYGSQVQRPPSRAASMDSRLSVRTSASELEARQKLEKQQRAEQLEIELESDKAKNKLLDQASHEEAEAQLREIEAKRRSEELRQQAEELRRREGAEAQLREIETKRRSEELRRHAEVAAKEAALQKQKEFLDKQDSDSHGRASLNVSLDFDRGLQARGPTVPESNTDFVFPPQKEKTSVPSAKVTTHAENSSDTHWSANSGEAGARPAHPAPTSMLTSTLDRLHLQPSVTQNLYQITDPHDRFIIGDTGTQTSPSIPLATNPLKPINHSSPPVMHLPLINPQEKVIIPEDSEDSVQ